MYFFVKKLVFRILKTKIFLHLFCKWIFKKEIKFSVIVTSYNYEKYIRDTLESIVYQTYKPYEIVIIDDASTDRSASIIKNYASKYDNIKYIQNIKNLGLVETSKIGLSQSTGDYICFCESDDYWDINHLKYLNIYISFFKEANLICNKIQLINNSRKNFMSYLKKSEKFLKKHDGKNIFMYSKKNYMPSFSATCFHSKFINELDLNSYLPQYLDFWIWRQLCYNNPVFYCEDSITFWRRHNSSYDMRAHVKDLTQFLEASDKLILKI